MVKYLHVEGDILKKVRNFDILDYKESGYK